MNKTASPIRYRSVQFALIRNFHFFYFTLRIASPGGGQEFSKKVVLNWVCVRDGSGNPFCGAAQRSRKKIVADSPAARQRPNNTTIKNKKNPDNHARIFIDKVCYFCLMPFH